MSVYFKFFAFILAHFSLWFILSAKKEYFYLASGLISSVICFIYARKILKTNGFTSSQFKIKQAIIYFPWLLKEIFVSSLQVTKIIWDFRLPINPAFVKYSHNSDDVMVYLTANSITLTPGTVTIEANSQEILVHELSSSNIYDIEKLEIYKKIKKCFHLCN